MDSELCRQVVEDPSQYPAEMLEEAAEQEGVSEEEKRRLRNERLQRPPSRRRVLHLERWLEDESKGRRLGREVIFERFGLLEERVEHLEKPWWRRAWEALRG